MTVRKLWLIILILIAVISISINAFILSALTNKYFRNSQAENYDDHFNQIVEYAKEALQTDNLSIVQMSFVMETHLDDPITRIVLYDSKGSVLVDVGTNSHMMMDNNPMGMMNPRYRESDSETDNVEIIDNNKTLGYLKITRYSSIEDSIVSRMFQSSLMLNSLFSVAIVLIIAVIIGVFISKRMSKDLMETAKFAQDITLGSDGRAPKSNIKEIRTIQYSLEELKNRLKLKSKSRKVLIDELVHQTRTPLTVLKTHLEGFSDNIIEMTPEEIKVCEGQIDNLTAIISNMSNMIDAGKDFDVLKIEEFEITALLKQIASGLKVQFDNKKIKFNIYLGQKVIMNTDKYKLGQIIYNILTNAYKYTDENGEVSLSCLKKDKVLSIIIEDNGIGISQDNLEKIFYAYYRSNTIDRGQGEGLGLYLAKENIEKIHGRIDVVSNLNKGSKFIIEMPIDISVNGTPE